MNKESYNQVDTMVTDLYKFYHLVNNRIFLADFPENRFHKNLSYMEPKISKVVRILCQSYEKNIFFNNKKC